MSGCWLGIAKSQENADPQLSAIDVLLRRRYGAGEEGDVIASGRVAPCVRYDGCSQTELAGHYGLALRPGARWLLEKTRRSASALGKHLATRLDKVQSKGDKGYELSRLLLDLGVPLR